jgi:uncharacterized membrane protein (UPF0127 family)
MKRTLFVMAAATLAAMTMTVHAQEVKPRAEVAFPDRTIVRAEVAETDAEHERGLMFRQSLGEEDGMIFVFTAPGLHAFWMKNTLIPLDMLWLDEAGRVVSIAESVPPCKIPECPTYPPRAQATYVLEVNAGFTKKHGLRLGDTLAISGIEKRALPQ